MRWLLSFLIALVGGITIFKVTIFDSVKVEKIELWGRYDLPPPKQSLPPPPGKTILSCTTGQHVAPTYATVHVRFLGVQDGESLRAIMQKPAGSSQDKHTSILEAISTEKVKRLSEGGVLTVTLGGVVYSDEVPSEVPFLAGDNICQRMVQLQRSSDGTLVTSISIQGGRLLSQASLVLPRAMLATSPSVRLCVQPSFPMAYGRDLSQNAHCDALGNSDLHQAALRGASARTTIVTRR